LRKGGRDNSYNRKGKKNVTEQNPGITHQGGPKKRGGGLSANGGREEGIAPNFLKIKTEKGHGKPGQENKIVTKGKKGKKKRETGKKKGCWRDRALKI